jgi:hypothetical protein
MELYAVDDVVIVSTATALQIVNAIVTNQTPVNN